jgi:hypothetical protein
MLRAGNRVENGMNRLFTVGFIEKVTSEQKPGKVKE